jgi:hypothetical protein
MKGQTTMRDHKYIVEAYGQWYGTFASRNEAEDWTIKYVPAGVSFEIRILCDPGSVAPVH